MNRLTISGTLVATSLFLCASAAAQTGTCDVSAGDDGASETACISAIEALGNNTVVDDVFTDAAGKTGDQLPAYGQLVDPFGGCDQANTICNGDLGATQDTPNVACDNASRDFATVADYVRALDWRYANPIRMHDGHATNGACPDFTDAVTDGNKEGYKPWEGLVFDLEGPSNKVVLFPVNDHGPQPCESVEYTVYLTDNPQSREVIDNPTTEGADPRKWNRAKLSRIYLEGWSKVRPGVDGNLDYTIEADSFSSVWSLPCGITFRYVGVIAGNDGKDLPECNFDSYDAELDAVAGLTEAGEGVCPDADRDGFVSCDCSNAPAVCDCADDDPDVHPGASELCDDPDKDCDGQPGGCEGQDVCYQSVCVSNCFGRGDVLRCPGGTTCQTTAMGQLCIPDDCRNVDCPPSSVCDPDTHRCRPACDDVTCPHGQTCRDGACTDLCDGVQCPTPQVCIDGECSPPCSCFNGDSACEGGDVCDRGGTDQCLPPACVGMSCGGDQYCDDQGMCVDLCDGVTCPAGQECVASEGGCVSTCYDVTCSGDQKCDPALGACVDAACVGVSCGGGQVCVDGSCQDGDTTGDPDAGTASDGGAGNGGVSGGKPNGCGCREMTTPAPSSGTGVLLLLIGLAGFVIRRR